MKSSGQIITCLVFTGRIRFWKKGQKDYDRTYFSTISAEAKIKMNNSSSSYSRAIIQGNCRSFTENLPDIHYLTDIPEFVPDLYMFNLDLIMSE